MTATDRLFGGSALRYLAVLAAAALTFTLLPLAGTASGQEEEVPECDPAPFTDRDDIPQAHRNNVDCAFEEGIVQGFTDNTYRPALSVRRDQMGTFIHGVLVAAGVDVPEGESDTFDDVPDGNVHSDAVNALAEAEVVFGGPGNLPPNQYGPALSTRRDQMTSFMMRAAEFATGNTYGSNNQQFPDVPSSNVHFQNVNAAAENNLALGRTDGTFAPGDETRRDQMGSFMIRLLLFIRGEMEPTTPDPTPTPTPEVDEPPTATDGPELVSAEFVRHATDGTFRVTHVRLQFDEAIASVVDSSLFWLWGPDTGENKFACFASVVPSCAVRESGNPNGVIAQFHRNEFEHATTAAVDRGAVNDIDGVLNPEGARGLQSVSYTSSIGPDLMAFQNVILDPGDPDERVRADAVFNRRVDGPAIAGLCTAAEEFALVHSGGAVIPCDEIATHPTDATILRVFFDRNDARFAPHPTPPGGAPFFTAVQVRDQSVRGYVQAGEVPALEDPFYTNPFGSAMVRSPGRESTPNILSVSPDPDNHQATVTYDSDISPWPAGDNAAHGADHGLYYQNTSPIMGISATRPTPRTVLVTFPDGAVHGLVTGAFNVEGAVTAFSDARENRADQVSVPRTFGPHVYMAPRLNSAIVRPRTDLGGALAGNEAVLQFSVPVADALGAGAEVNAYNQAGTRTELTDCDATRGETNEVICRTDTNTLEDSALQAAVLIGVNDDTVTQRATRVDGTGARMYPNAQRSVPAQQPS